MGKFSFIPTDVAGVMIIELTVFGDERGYFMETYSEKEFAAAGIPGPFVQDNQSKSTRGVLRGLHFQKQHPQGKLVRVVSWQWTAAPTPTLSASGLGCASRRQTNASFTFPKALPTAFLC